MDITIKNCPKEAEEEAKKMALVAIERYLKRKNLVVPADAKKTFEEEVDTIREANGLDKKFAKEEEKEEIK